MIINKTIEWLKDISTKGGLKKALDYGGISLWWFYEFGLYYLVKDYIKNQKDSNRSALKKDTPKFISKVDKYYVTSKAVTRFILGKIMTKNKQSEIGSTHKILAVSYTGYWKNFPTPQKENKKTNRDTMLGSIITALKNKNFNVVALDDDSEFFIDFKTMIEKRVQGKELWRPVEFYLTFHIIKKVFKAAKKYEEEWDKLKNNKEFIDSLKLNYERIRLSNLLNDYFEKLFRYRTFSPVLDIELMKRAIEVEKPDLVLITCGYCQLGRAAAIVGKLKGVPTLEVQHGNIGPSHRGYMHAKDEIAPDGCINSPYCPIPDKTAVYGNYYKDLLTKASAYPEDSVVVTGQPRYDLLADADKIFDKKKFYERYKLDPKKKIVLIMTENLPIFEDNVIFLENVLKSTKKIPDIQIVVKPHPNEKSRWYEEVIKKENIKAAVLSKRSDTYEAIYACDLMIAFFSTTITEALILERSVITVNLTGRPDPMPYAESGAAIGVYRSEDLVPAIKSALYDKNTRERLKNDRERFIYEHHYALDGKATERVVNLITRMIKEKRKRNEI